jgi:hypothetical protein
MPTDNLWAIRSEPTGSESAAKAMPIAASNLGGVLGEGFID